MRNNEITQTTLAAKAVELGLWEEAFVCALHIISSNRHLVNAMDNRAEMDDYIYRSIIRTATNRRKRKAEEDLESNNEAIQAQGEKDLAMLSREELTTDAYYRAVLPIIAKVIQGETILRLHAEEAADIVLKLADFKRRHRVTSVTEVIVTKCKAELENFDHSAYAAALEVV